MLAKAIQIRATHRRRLLQQRPLALQASKARPRSEWKLDLIAIEHLKQNRFVPIMAKPRQTFSEDGDPHEEIGCDDHERSPAESIGYLLDGVRAARFPLRGGAFEQVDYP